MLTLVNCAACQKELLGRRYALSKEYASLPRAARRMLPEPLAGMLGEDVEGKKHYRPYCVTCLRQKMEEGLSQLSLSRMN